MPLSNVLGAQSITKPGVCTSTTRPASPFDGQVIYETDTDRIAVYDSSSWVYKTRSAANEGLTFIGKTTFSAVSSVNVDNVFSSSYENYKIIINLSSAGSQITGMRMRTTTTTETGSVYCAQLRLWGNDGGNSRTDKAPGTSWDICWHHGPKQAAIEMTVANPNLTKETVITGTAANQYGLSQTNGVINQVFAGWIKDTVQYSGFTLMQNSGTDAITGTVRVYGWMN